jgi:hypothetical protein
MLSRYQITGYVKVKLFLQLIKYHAINTNGEVEAELQATSARCVREWSASFPGCLNPAEIVPYTGYIEDGGH